MAQHTLLLAVLLAIAVAAAAQVDGGACFPSGFPKLCGYVSKTEAASSARKLAQLTGKQRRELFQQWRDRSGRKYKDDGRRYRAWESSLNATVRWNTRPSVPFIRGITEFSDATPAELASKFLMSGVNPARARNGTVPRSAARGLQAALPDDWDWRQVVASGTVLGVPPMRQHQGACGSCWAFASLAALESRARKDGTNLGADLSEQQLIDCVNSAAGYQSAGCGGGLAEDVFNYVSRNYALREVDYRPYAAANGTGCRAAAASRDNAIKIVGPPSYDVVRADPESLMTAIVNFGPAVIYFNVELSFFFYTSDSRAGTRDSVYPASACRRDDTINHAMLVVGFSRGGGYWIVRNSWGRNWGEDGYARIEMKGGRGTCGMALHGAVVPRMTAPAKGSAIRRPPPPPPARPRDSGCAWDFSPTEQCTDVNGAFQATGFSGTGCDKIALRLTNPVPPPPCFGVPKRGCDGDGVKMTSIRDCDWPATYTLLASAPVFIRQVVFGYRDVTASLPFNFTLSCPGQPAVTATVTTGAPFPGDRSGAFAFTLPSAVVVPGGSGGCKLALQSRSVQTSGIVQLKGLSQGTP